MFDKSVLQMLSSREMFELSIFFEPIGTPVLTNEIVADLEKPAGKGRIPREVVKELAAKMWGAPVEPMNFRKAAIGNLIAAMNVPMTGATFLDISAPNITATPGRGIYIDATAVQHVWERWAEGNFTPIEEEWARVLRKGVEGYDPGVVREEWEPFVRDHFAKVGNMHELVRGVDDLLSSFDRNVQSELLRVTLDVLRAPADVRRFAFQLFRAGLMPRVKDLAPYAAAVLRLTLVYACAISRSFVRAGPQDITDLQYLCYAPFCHVFASNDRLHRDLWPAASGPAFFMWGDDLKVDLRRRADLREQSPDRVAGTTPIELPNSIINQACNRWKRKAK